MLLKDEVEQLRRVSLFSTLDPARLKLLAFTSDRARFEPGQTLFRQGEVGDAAYVVLKGEAEVLVESDVGEVKVATMGCNSIVGEIAILSDTPRTATVRAATELETLKIQKDPFLRLIAEFPEVAIAIMRVLAERLSRTTAELTEARAAAEHSKS